MLDDGERSKIELSTKANATNAIWFAFLAFECNCKSIGMVAHARNDSFLIIPVYLTFVFFVCALFCPFLVNDR